VTNIYVKEVSIIRTNSLLEFPKQSVIQFFI